VVVLSSGVILNAMACGKGEKLTEPSLPLETTINISSEPLTPPDPIEIVIGNYTDKTGPSASPSSVIDMALEDMVRYYNEEALIPGVTFKVVSYDSQVDPANDIPGYKYLKKQGADVIFTIIPSAPMTLKPLLEKDKTVLFTGVPDPGAIDPPGYVFGVGSPLLEHHSYTLLEWLPENDPDFPDDRPAKIGGAGWATGYMDTVLKGAEAYARAHPEQYVWKGDYVSGIKFDWLSEAEALKDCDYVFPPCLMNQFVEQIRTAGFSGKLIGTSIHTAFFEVIDDADIWHNLDGMQLIMSYCWWNEDCEIMQLTEELLERYHPGELEEMQRTGNGYLIVNSVYIMFEMIRKAVEEVGIENFSSQAVYNAASGFSLEMDGRITDTFSRTKRASRNWLAIYAFDAEKENLVRFNPEEWLEVREEP